MIGHILNLTASIKRAVQGKRIKFAKFSEYRSKRILSVFASEKAIAELLFLMSETELLLHFTLYFLKLPAELCCIYAQRASSLKELALLLKEETVLNTKSFAAACEQAEHLLCQLSPPLKILVYGKIDYPALLTELHNPSYLLFCYGEPYILTKHGYSVVGSRNASDWGLQMAYHLGLSLAQSGCLVVSGMARGIDKAVMQGALDAQGCCVAVLGSGLDANYPAHARAMRRQIIEQQGVILSPFPLGTPPYASNFPKRNRFISGLTMETVLLDVGRRSGASITAAHALDQGREVSVIGDSVGTRRFVEQGAAYYPDSSSWLKMHNLKVVRSRDYLQDKDYALQLAENLRGEIDGSFVSYRGTYYHL